MMLSETARLLGICALYDSRAVSELEVAGWHEIVGDLGYEDAKAAVLAWHSESHPFRISPGDVVSMVRQMRHARIENKPDPLPLCDPDDVDAYLAEIRANRQALADGQLPPERLALPGLSPEQVKANQDRLEQMLAPAFRRPPRVSQ